MKLPHVLAFYGDWQRLRFWVLLEAYTYLGLLNPKRVEPSDVGRSSWDNNLNGKVRTWTVGDARMLGIVDELERENWLVDLYEARRILNWASVLYSTPEALRWEEGEALDEGSRWDATILKVREALASIDSRWRAELLKFGAKIRLLIELWQRAAKRQSTSLTSAVEDDLRVAEKWAGFLFDKTFEQLDSAVGREVSSGLTLAHVLRPNWRNARDEVEQSLPGFLGPFNATMKPITLNADDIPAFLDFVDSQQLVVWYLELAEITGREPSDTLMEHRFVYLRSMALLVQPVIAALADILGTAADRSKVESGSTKGPMSAFLMDRSDWRHNLWLQVGNNWRFTQTTAGVRLEDRLREIDSMSITSDCEGAVKTLLTLAALRNFGGHRFSNDPRLLRTFWPHLQRAVVFTPFFYWKIARDLG